MIMFGDPDGFRAYVAPLIHNYIADGENERIGHYRDNVDWLIAVGSKGGLNFAATLRKGNRSSYGSIELNARYPLAKLSGGDLSGMNHAAVLRQLGRKPDRLQPQGGFAVAVGDPGGAGMR
jgi:hypothetical protein